MLQIKPSQAAIARALGLANSRITAMKKRGMPVDSIEAAKAWRTAHVAPVVRTARRTVPADIEPAPVGLAAAIRHAVALADLAGAALEVGNFAAVEPALRQALAAIPPQHRYAMPGLPLAVWDALCGDVAIVVEEFEASIKREQAEADPAVTAEAVDRIGAFWYQVAAGEIRRTD